MPTTEEQLENALHLLQYERHRGVAERVATLEAEHVTALRRIAELTEGLKEIVQYEETVHDDSWTYRVAVDLLAEDALKP